MARSKIKKKQNKDMKPKASAILLKTVYEKHPSVIYRENEQILQLIHLESSAMHSIDGFARNIWLALDGRTSLQDVIKAVGDELEIDVRSQLRFEKDTYIFVEKLISNNLILAS